MTRRRISKGVKSLGSPLSKTRLAIAESKTIKKEKDVKNVYYPEPRFVDLSDGDGSVPYTTLSDTEHSI
jgi:hypothetical protein